METSDLDSSGSDSTFFEEENEDSTSDAETALLPGAVDIQDVVNHELDTSVDNSITYYMGSDSDMGDEDEETRDMGYDGYAAGSPGPSGELMNASMFSNGSVTLHFLGSPFNDEDIDVVDGPEEQLPTSHHRIVMETDGNSDDEVPSTSNSVRLIKSSSVSLPPGVTSSEHIARIANWVLESSPPASGGGGGEHEDQSSEENKAMDYISKLISLCAEKLDKCPLFLSTVGSVSEFGEGSETLFQLIVRLLESNYITEALMQIINLIWTMGSFGNSHEKDGDEACKSREVMLMVLNCASARRTRLDAVAIEKILSHNIFTDGEFFRNVSLCTNIKMPSKEFTVFQSVETWINNALQVALECQTAVVDLDIRVILEVILEVNRGRSLFLSPEEESKYAGKAQRVVREILFRRCHTYLRSQGLVFEDRERPQQEMAYYYPPYNDRAVPTVSPRTQNQAYVDAWLRNEIADALYALARDDANSRENSPPRQRYHGNGDQVLPTSGSSRGSSGGGRLFETAIDFGGIDFGRLSQDSLASRMNQGYNSSQSLSQGSLPRIPLSQSSRNSSMNRFMSFDNQYILENQFFPSSSESSSGPTGPKRPRLGYSNSQ